MSDHISGQEFFKGTRPSPRIWSDCRFASHPAEFSPIASGNPEIVVRNFTFRHIGRAKLPDLPLTFRLRSPAMKTPVAIGINLKAPYPVACDGSNETLGETS
jgi:hypothetical protein